MEAVFTPIERTQLKENGFPKKGIKSTKTVVHSIRKLHPSVWKLISQLNRYTAMQSAISKQKEKGQYVHNPVHDTLRQNIRDILQKLLDCGMGSMQEVIAHCKTYDVRP